MRWNPTLEREHGRSQVIHFNAVSVILAASVLLTAVLERRGERVSRRANDCQTKNRHDGLF